jgi:hypothetical protein
MIREQDISQNAPLVPESGIVQHAALIVAAHDLALVAKRHSPKTKCKPKLTRSITRPGNART